MDIFMCVCAVHIIIIIMCVHFMHANIWQCNAMHSANDTTMHTTIYGLANWVDKIGCVKKKEGPRSRIFFFNIENHSNLYTECECILDFHLRLIEQHTKYDDV